MTDTIDVVDRYVVHGSQSLTFLNQTGFVFDNDGSGDPSLINFGDILVTDDASGGGGTLVGITGEGSELWIKPGATYSVISTIGADAYGYTTSYASPQTHNEGTWTVASAGRAIGAFLWAGSTFDNVGTFDVHGGEDAYGITTEYGVAFSNEGDFTVTSDAGTAIAVLLEIWDFTFTNSGSIVAKDGDGSESVAVQFGHDDYFHAVFDNSGLIKGDWAFREVQVLSPTQQSPDTLNNSGRIVGKIDMGMGDDAIHNVGKIKGDVLMGKGDDIYHATGHGKLFGALYGGLGDDALTGNAGHDVIYGDDGQDSGQDGDDILSGGKGGDALFGNDGADTLIGGAGADTLTGGFGRDVFAYGALADSAPGQADVIADLGKSDVIDLSAIDADVGTAGDQAFTLVSSFGGHAGEATLSYDAGSDTTTLQLDVDGDGAADGEVLIAGDHHDFTNFLL